MAKKPAKKASKALGRKDMKKTRGGFAAEAHSSLSAQQHNTHKGILQNLRG